MYKKILFPTDGSPASLQAAESVASLAATIPDAVVTVLVVISLMDPAISDFSEEVILAQNAKIRKHAEQAVEKTLKVFGCSDVRAEPRIAEGDPTSLVIAKIAADERF